MKLRGESGGIITPISQTIIGGGSASINTPGSGSGGIGGGESGIEGAGWIISTENGV